ncbi:hypothetical protein [Rariglobus hedericola]|uniref:Uncharacterized protein n=1 Tax=Rariglobus hedericola TaxID=2597822 RepID=A0A556QIS8_9BACT|nr:hypothetical protein [Rariglobus hedericola]TSJ76553.1 hypothetical protein FPL22_10500 [Rariglobus hedericola]
MPTQSAASPVRFFMFFTCLIASALLVGCGGGSNKTDPAPSSLNGRTITFRDAIVAANTAYTYTGSVSGTYSSTDIGDTGTFTYTKTMGTTDKAVLQMTSTVFLSTTTYNLTFASGSGGSYSDDLPSNGTFTIN